MKKFIGFLLILSVLIINSVLSSYASENITYSDNNYSVNYGLQEKINTDLPFEFLCKGSKVELTLKNELCDNIVIVISEYGSKTNVYNENTKKNKIDISRIDLHKLYNFTLNFIVFNKSVTINDITENTYKEINGQVNYSYSGILQVTNDNGTNKVVVEGISNNTFVDPKDLDDYQTKSNKEKSLIKTTTGGGIVLEVESLMDSQSIVTADIVNFYESEPNDTSTDATQSYEDSITFGFIDSSTDVDWIKMTASKNTMVVALSVPNKDYDISVYDSVNLSTKIAGGYNSGASNEAFSFTTVPGHQYYFQIYGYRGNYDSYNYYQLSVNGIKTDDLYESNNSTSTATSLIDLWGSIDGKLQASIDVNSDIDYYWLYLPQNSKIYVNLDNIPGGCDFDVALCDSRGATLIGSYNSSSSSESFVYTAESGLYYVKVFAYRGFSQYNYDLKINHSMIWENQDHGTWTVTNTYDDPDTSSVTHTKTIYLNKKDSELYLAAINDKNIKDVLLDSTTGYITDLTISAACELAGIGFFPSALIGLNITLVKASFDIADYLDLKDAMDRSTTGKIKLEYFWGIYPSYGKYVNAEPWNDDLIVELRGYHGTYKSSLDFSY